MGKIVGQSESFVCHLAGQMKTLPEIQEQLLKIHKIEIGTQAIRRFIERKKDYVARIRETYLADISDVPIAQEKIRLERDEALYQLSQTLSNVPTRIEKGISCLREAREELKGGTYQFNQFNQYNQFTDEQLLEKQKKIESQIIDLSKEEKVEVREEILTDGKR